MEHGGRVDPAYLKRVNTENSKNVFMGWCLLALASLIPVTALLEGSFPIFTVLWILVPLGVVLKTRDARRVGFRRIPWREFVRVTAINLGGLFLISLVIEPWSHTYQRLLEAALSSRTPDTTFAWLLRYPRVPALGVLRRPRNMDNVIASGLCEAILRTE